MSNDDGFWDENGFWYSLEDLSARDGCSWLVFIAMILFAIFIFLVV